MIEKLPPEMFECDLTISLSLVRQEARIEILRLRVELDHACNQLNELRRDLAKYEGRR